MSINTALLAELKQESANTKKMLERVPTDKLEWRPHAKSMKIGKLAKHIADLPAWVERIITTNEFDSAVVNLKLEEPSSTEAILKLFDEKLKTATTVLETASDENLNSMWTFRRGDHIFFSMPKKVALRSFSLNHTYHHRGQLSVYLRLLDVSVPGMYGPSADESF